MFKLEDFERIGAHGVGNPRSGMAHSMCYFKDHVYVGVTHSKGETPDDAARILRYDPVTRTWGEVYRSPLIKADIKAHATMTSFPVMSKLAALKAKKNPPVKHEYVPRERGFRGMTIITDKRSAKPMLCVSTMSHWGSQLMCSEDGENFRIISEPGLGNPDILSFRCLVPFRDKLFIAPVGSVKEGVLERNMSDIATLYVSDDPVAGDWQEAIEPGFGDECNRGIFSLAAFKGYLYAGTSNPVRGFEIWKTDAQGKPPFRWEPVMQQGAFRYNLNHTASTLTEFKDHLYISSALPGLGQDKEENIGPAAAELLRLDDQGNWDLLVGTPRFTADGLKVPLSLRGAGFEDPENSLFWAMAVHDGVLYAGSHNNRTWRHALAGDEEIRGGFHLWATSNGETWQPISLDGFGDPYSVGIRTMLSTPHGLFIGTLNHREIEKIWHLRTGRRNEATGEGGFDIFHAHAA
jgi:hypothetical protein